MIVEYIRYAIPDNECEAFEQGYARAQVPLAASPHCQGYELARCTEDPTRYTLRIVWDSLDGHMRGFRSSPEFREFFGHIKPFVGMIEEMRHYAPTAVRGGNG